MAVTLGYTYPELFSAVGCHSGLPHGCATDSYSAMEAMRDGAPPLDSGQAAPSIGVPVISFHGDLDATVHPQNSLGVVQQCVDHYRARQAQEDAGLHFKEETGEAAGRRFTRRIHQLGAGETIAEHWIVHGTGHAWLGGHWRGSYTDACGPDASREMLRFFMQHKRKVPAFHSPTQW